jgi:hypothetical protein
LRPIIICKYIPFILITYSFSYKYNYLLSYPYESDSDLSIKDQDNNNLDICINNQENKAENELITYLNKKKIDKKVSL